MDTKAKILKAAEIEFANKGFHDTLVSDIANRAKVGKGTIYRYFPSKEDLFCSIIISQMESFESKIKDVIDSNKSEEEILKDIGKIHFEEYKKSKEVISILVLEGLSKIEKVEDEFKKRIVRIQNMVAQVIKKGISKGIFRNVSCDKVAVIFLSVIWTVLKHGIFMQEEEIEKRYFSTIFDTIFYGILK